MEILLKLTNLINVEAIMALPWETKGPALAVIAFFVLRGVTSLFKFRLIKMTFSFFYAILLAILLSAFAPVISTLAPDDNKSVEEKGANN